MTKFKLEALFYDTLKIGMAGQKTDTFLNKLYVFFVKNGQKFKKINNKNKYNSEVRCFIVNSRDRTEIKIKNKKNVYVFILILLIPFAVFFRFPNVLFVRVPLTNRVCTYLTNYRLKISANNKKQIIKFDDYTFG